jgi:hypothetical protein
VDEVKWEGPQVQSHSPTTKGKDVFSSDSSCFVPWADAKTTVKPICAGCGQDAVGGNFIEAFSGGPAGRPSGIVRFSCGCDGARYFAISVSTLFPQWRLISEPSPGTWRVVKTTRAEREKLCTE